jgi:hypothetical protein
MSRKTLWQITGHRFCAGLVVVDGVVSNETAPILRWTRGRKWDEVRAAMKHRGWHGVPIPIQKEGL